MEKNKIERPSSIIIVSVILLLFQAGVIAYKLKNGNALDLGALVTACMLVGLYGIWNMKKWGMWIIILCMTVIAVMNTQVTDRPIRDFFYTGFPMILMVFACMYPHRNRMT